MVHVRLEPLALLWKIVGFESCEITSHLRIETRFAFQRENDRFRGIKMFLHLIKLIHSIHFHAADGLGNLLRN